MSFNIIGTGSSVPETIVDNNRMGEFVETNDEWITQRTGIRERRILRGESLTDLAAESAEKALCDGGVHPSELDMIICSTLQGDYLTPSLACLVQERIGASCTAFDVNAACSGFIYALDIADAYIKSGKAEKILIVCAEAMSRVVDWQDRTTCVLFGDGAGAVLIEKGSGLLTVKATAAGSKQHLRAPVFYGNSPLPEGKGEDYYLKMNGQEVYKFAVSTVERDVDFALKQTGLTSDDIDWYLLHQANSRITEAARKRLGQPKEKFPGNIGRYGNTSSASIPILLDEINRAGKIKTGDKLLMNAFGAGMTTGVCIISWNK